jgi:hypothetical protein
MIRSYPPAPINDEQSGTTSLSTNGARPEIKKNKSSDFPAPFSVQIDANSFAINTNPQKSRSNFVEFIEIFAIFVAKTTPLHSKFASRPVKTGS